MDESAKVLRQCATNPTEVCPVRTRQNFSQTQESVKLLRAHYRTIVRMAQEAPFSEIRQVFRELVAFLHSQVAPTRLLAPTLIVTSAETRATDGLGQLIAGVLLLSAGRCR